MIAPGDQQPERGCKFAEHLTAGSAGPAVISGGAYHGKTDKIIPVPFADRFYQCGTLGADACPVGSVFHIASRIDASVYAQYRSSHLKV